MSIDLLISYLKQILTRVPKSDEYDNEYISNLLSSTIHDLQDFNNLYGNKPVEKSVSRLVEHMNTDFARPTISWARSLFNAVSDMIKAQSPKTSKARRAFMKYIDGETATNWAGIISTFLLFISSIIAVSIKGIDNIDYDRFGFIIQLVVAALGLILYCCIFLYNFCIRKRSSDYMIYVPHKEKSRLNNFQEFVESKTGTCIIWCLSAIFTLLSVISFSLIAFLAFSIQPAFEKAVALWEASFWCGWIALLGAAVVGVLLVFGYNELGVKKVSVPRVFVIFTLVFCVISMILQTFYKPVQPRNDIIEYVSNQDGTCQAVIVPQDEATEYIIPLEYDGMAVTNIGRKFPEKELYIKALDIGANVKIIEDEAFAHSRGLTQLTIPQSVTEIGNRAFYNSQDLAFVTLNCNLQSVNNSAFETCDNLLTVYWNVVNENVKFKDIFASCESVKNVILGQEIQSITQGMFDNCKSIENVVLYENITSIGNDAFANCDSLESVFYRGSESQWNSVNIGGDNDSLNTAKFYYYSQQEPQLSDDGLSYNGNYWHVDENGLPVVWNYIPPTYTVKFYADGKLCKEVNYLKNDTHIEEPTVPVKKGYTGEWEKYALNNEDITVNAVYTPKTYTLNFDYKEADGGIDENSKTVTFDQSVGKLPTPTKVGYIFDGWYLGDQKITSSTKWINDDDEFYMLVAHYIAVHVVHFYVDGEQYKDVEYLEGQNTIEEPAVPVKKGYTGVWEKYTLNNSDITVNAVYTAKNYKLVFDYNGATDGIGLDSKIVTYDEIVGDLPQPTAGLSNIFVGWYIGDVCINSSTVWTYDGQDAYIVQAHYECLDFYGGSGTEQNPFLIESVDDFLNIKLYPTVYYELITDIDMTDIDYTVISSFSGNLDGKGHCINNLSLYSNAVETNKIGIFGINNGTVRNLNLRYCSFTLSPMHHNNTVTNYCGTIAGVNNGTIENCHILESKVISNSSDVADKFMTQFNEDPREIERGSANWTTWITQSFATPISKWPAVPMDVFAGGIVGLNSGNVINCSFGGKVEANMYNMHCYCNDNKAGISGKGQHNCFAGGLAGQNEGTISQSEANAQVRAWIELNNNGNGNGWVGDMYVWGVCYACGLAGNNVNGTVDGKSNCTQQADYRIYAPQYAFLSGANYNSTTKGHPDNLTIGTSDTYK